MSAGIRGLRWKQGGIAPGPAFLFCFFFSIRVFFHKHLRFTGFCYSNFIHGFCYSNFIREIGGYELTLTITLCITSEPINPVC